MTSLRFVGDLPLWLGLVLAAIVAVTSWIYYNRESFELPGRLRVLLPLLRSTAFVLGILILTGPVLHHTKTIGQLGKVKVFVDLSQSMTQLDKHMELARKLRIAKQLGWLVEGLPDFPVLDDIGIITTERQKLLRLMLRETNAQPAAKGNRNDQNLAEPISRFVELVESLEQLPAETKSDLKDQILTPLKTLVDNPSDLQANRIRNILDGCERLENRVIGQVNTELQLKMSENDGSLVTAIDLFDNAPRWRRIAMALQGNESDDVGDSLLDQLRNRHDVEVFLMDQPDSTTTRIESGQRLPTKDWEENNKFVESTDLHDRINASLKKANAEDSDSGQVRTDKAAVVLLSDGRHNRGPSPVKLARTLSGQGYSFYNVAIGATRPAMDLAVLKVEHPKLVFKKDEIRGSMTIRDSMSPGKPFVAQVLHGEEILWQKQLVAQDIRERQIDFQFKVDELMDKLDETKPGTNNAIEQLALKASIVPLAEESETSNNSQPIRLSVITDGYKVLILDGRSRWETRFIRNAFERDQQWEVQTILAGKLTSHPTLPHGEEPGQFPISKAGLFDFDLIIWGELDPELLDEKEFKWVAEFVETRGGGMIFIDGLRGKLRQLESTAIADLVPVLSVKEPITKLPTSLELSPPGADQPALALNTDKLENQQFWKELPAPHTLVPIEPTADSIVMVHVNVEGEKLPAIVTRNYGAGKVLYLSFDESWRWRYKTADTWHQRAWQQLAKFAMPQPYSVSDEFVSLDTGPASYEQGDRPAVRVKLKGLDGKPNSDAIVDALVWKDGRVVSTVNLKVDPGIPGVYRSRLDQLESGEYEVSVRASGYQESKLDSRGRFLVLPPKSGELSESSVNEELLNQMAEESGGRYLLEEELSKLPELLDPLSNGRVVESETLLWQSYWWFGGMILLLTIEWVFRKRAGLL